MNSETIKEIKECLEVLNEYGETYITKDQTQRKFVDYADILTYINELESENQRLGNESNEMFGKYGKELQTATILIEKRNNEIIELKDRIAELEKENARLDKVVKHNQELIENGKLVSSEQLKQFAEKLKEKMSEGEYYGHKYKLAVFRDIDIDETLNEFLKGE